MIGRQRIAERDERQLILFVDELQELTSGAYGDPEQITRRLREVQHDSTRVTCLFAGSVEHLMRDMFSNERRALYQFGGFHELSPIADDEWREGLRDRFERDDCIVDAEALDLIVAAGEGHPRTTMLIAQQAHHASVEEGTRRIDGTLAERGLNALADASVVIRPGGRGSWKLADPLFSAYVRREIHAG
jgi:type II secretory pathway predicted ATPase ExeA